MITFTIGLDSTLDCRQPFRKQFLMYSGFNASQDEISARMASNKFHLQIFFWFSICSIDARTNCFLKLCFTKAMIPWSRGCIRLVVFGGKKYTVMLDKVKPLTSCAEQLSIVNKIFRFWVFIQELNFKSHVRNAVLSTQAFFWHVYWHLSFDKSMFLKQRGFLLFPIIHTGSFSLPSALHVKTAVILSLLLLPPWQLSPLTLNVRWGKRLKKIPLSSTLKISLSAKFFFYRFERTKPLINVIFVHFI